MSEYVAPVSEDVSNPKPEILDRHYKVLVVDPYSVNIQDFGPNAGRVRLSFYSSMVIHTVRELIENGQVDSVILFDDASFGTDYFSTGDLSYDYLTQDRKEGRIINPGKVKVYKGDDFARTPTQVKAVATYLKAHGLTGDDALYLGWEYHRDRVETHARAFGFEVNYGSVTEIHKRFEPKFDADKLMRMLPFEEIEAMESRRRKMAKRDGKGVIPGIIQSLPIVGGPRMLDNKRMPDGRLAFDYRKGTARLKELGLK